MLDTYLCVTERSRTSRIEERFKALRCLNSCHWYLYWLYHAWDAESLNSAARQCRDRTQYYLERMRRDEDDLILLLSGSRLY
jgi:hypothetical protein